MLPDDIGYTGTARRVLEVATGLFAQRGFYGTSMRDIAEAVGVRPASIYEHFPSKDHILTAVLTIGHERIHDALDAAVTEAGDDPHAQVRAAVTTLVVQLCAWPELARTVNSEMRALLPEHATRPTEARDRVSLTLAEIMHRGVEQGVFVDRNLVVLVASIGGICIRAPYWFEPSDGYAAADLARDYGDLAIAMLTAPIADR